MTLLEMTVQLGFCMTVLLGYVGALRRSDRPL